jgi:predicted ATPase
MGAGKSTILGELKIKGYVCVDDPARQILAEQRSILGTGVPETDASLFNQLMLSRAIFLYKEHSLVESPVLFDRGIPDVIAYAELFGIDRALYERAASTYLYGSTVFCFAGWEEIYTLDDERKMDYNLASRFGENVGSVYKRLGYSIVEVPRISREKRVQFIIDTIERENGR